MKNIFEGLFGTPTPEKPPTDGAGYIAVPERGMDDSDINLEQRRIENEIRVIEAKLASDEDIDNRDFLDTKLTNLKAQLEQEKNK